MTATNKNTALYGGIILGSLLVLSACGYGLYSYKRTIGNLKSRLTKSEVELAATKAESKKNYQDFKDTIAGLQGSTSSLREQLATQQEKSTAVEQVVGAVSNSVGTLEKLSHTDPELLKQYSKVYFLNDHYVPVSLSFINPKYVNPSTKPLQIHSNVKPYLENLLADAATNGLTLQIDSAYRSFGTQAVLKQSYRVTYGAGTANSFSAEQGYSEHQLGTAVDFTTPKIDGGLSGFDRTVEYSWLNANAYRYGFVISYPLNNPSYQFEPWHWRFVGVKLATDIHNQNTYFYNMDQRIVDTYLAGIFD